MYGLGGTIKGRFDKCYRQEKEIINNYTENDTGKFNMSFKYDSDIVTGDNEPFDFNITMDGDTLDISYHADYRVNSTDITTGIISVVSGQIRISGDIPMTIDFKK